MAIQVTNQTASPAQRGQTVKVTLSGAEALSKLPLLSIGQRAAVVTGGSYGYISRIDTYGNSFFVSPRLLSTNLASSATPGILPASELINID